MNFHPPIPLHGLVLAGGRSTRMGSDKAALVHPDGRTLARRCCELLAAAGCESVVLSLRHDQEIPAGFDSLVVRNLPDSEVLRRDAATTSAHAVRHIESDSIVIVRDPAGASHGPMAGIVAAMRTRPDADWLVVACDLPRLDLTTLTQLIKSKESGEKFLAYRSEFDGLPEPLCTLYAPAALLVLEQAMADDFHCPRKILIRNACRLLEPITPRALANANTPDDWENARTP